VKEYILLKIACFLNVGPTFVKPFGFDLIIHDNCI